VSLRDGTPMRSNTRAAEIPLSAVLFTPLRWTATARPDFYQEQLVPWQQEGTPHVSKR